MAPVPEETIPAPPAPRLGVDWDNLGFGLTTKDTQMVVATCPLGGQWSTFEARPYGPLSIEPACTALNYGQSIFEGMKAFRTVQDRVVLFRPEMNAQRLTAGAERFMMPPLSGEFFMEMCAAAVRANADWIPPAGKGEMYLRPLLFGSGAALGVSPSPEYTCVIYVAPVGRYFKGKAARLQVSSGHNRAAPLGVGGAKAAGNYAPCFRAQAASRANGFSDVLYLDCGGKHIEEAAASNFFMVDKAGVLRTPLLGTILPGITRDSVLHLARHLVAEGGSGLTGVEVGHLTLDSLKEASEAFVTGTAAGVTPVEQVSGGDGEAFDLPAPGPIAALLEAHLRGIQLEQKEDLFGWLWDPYNEAEASAHRLARCLGADAL